MLWSKRTNGEITETTADVIARLEAQSSATQLNLAERYVLWL